MKTFCEKLEVKSALNGLPLNAKVYVPVVEAQIKGIFQITHGMAEHIERYDDFASFISSNGYVVVLHDHMGHGASSPDDEHLGYFGETGGWKVLVEDCREVTRAICDKYPDKPVVFFGHSMGSFVARAYAAKYGKSIKGAIFCGTSGANPAAGIAIQLAASIAKSKGELFRSEFINDLAFGSYNKKFKPARTDFDWLTKDESIVDAYVADKYCGFLFTAAGYRDMFTLLREVSGKRWYKTLSASLPILLISGAMDPVGDYGKGVKQVFTDLRKSGHTDVSMKLYPDDRHEILNELDRQTVYSDILEWADKVISA